MGGLFWNKVIGAVLATALAIFGIREFTHILVHPHQPETPGYAIAIESDTNKGEPAEAAPVISLAEMLAGASTSSGERVAKKCASCHTFEKGGATKTGPNLWAIINRPAASTAGFRYSSAMAGSGLSWDFETMDAFLAAPKKIVPGTAMSFAGLNKPKDRANILAWMRSMSDNPADFPAVPLAAEAAESSAAVLQNQAAGIAETGGSAASIVEAVKQAASNVAADVAEATEQAVSTTETKAEDLLDALPNVAGTDPAHTEAVEEAGQKALEEMATKDDE